MKTQIFAHQIAASIGGMGVVTPMKRSVTAVEMCARLDACRVTSRSSCGASAACHAKQICIGGELMQ